MSRGTDWWKRRTLALCWICYTISYLLRTNLSAVLDKMMVELKLSKASVGGIGSVFFWTYAVGQILAGFLAGRVNPKYMIALGLLLSALCNLGVALAGSYPMVLTLWGLNGLLLAMIWAPTFKILTNWFSAEEYRKVSVWISLPTTVGYLLSWGFIRVVASRPYWRMAFVLPGAAAALFLVAWMMLLRLAPERATDASPTGEGEPVEPQRSQRSRAPFGQLLFRFGLVFAGLCAIVQGLIKEGINLWGPTLLAEIGGQMAAGLVSAFSVLIPVCGTLGIFGVGYLVKRLRESSVMALLVLFLGAAVAAAGIYAARNLFVPAVLLLSLLMACACGANVLITVLIPMQFVKHNISAQVAGTLNFLCYVGAGLGGGTFGLVSDRWGWPSIYLLWASLCLAATLFVLAWRCAARASVSR